MQIQNYLSYGEPIKGWTLLRCLVDDDRARMGQWMLVYTKFVEEQRNPIFPSFTFQDLPFQHNFSDDDMEGFMNSISKFEKSLKTDPQTGYGFFHCCLTDGFDPFQDEFYVWVADRMTSRIIKTQGDMTPGELKSLLNMLVFTESYEKAAKVRDVLDGKATNISDIF
mgnify:FL=1